MKAFGTLRCAGYRVGTFKNWHTSCGKRSCRQDCGRPGQEFVNFSTMLARRSRLVTIRVRFLQVRTDQQRARGGVPAGGREQCVFLSFDPAKSRHVFVESALGPLPLPVGRDGQTVAPSQAPRHSERMQWLAPLFACRLTRHSYGSTAPTIVFGASDVVETDLEGSARCHAATYTDLSVRNHSAIRPKRIHRSS
jgi:hypothetical protein